jgi:biopolymer transport protein ExbD
MKAEITSAVQTSGKTKVRIAGEKTAYYDAVFQVLILAQSQEWQPVLAFDK